MKETTALLVSRSRLWSPDPIRAKELPRSACPKLC
uniref:Uncharacterized protein n=1 Tax=Anguilla anguilla TaxID=7936 RepID=A0A0E9UMH8_ANGAN